MSVHAKRVAGTISCMVDGEEVTARGSFEYRLSGVQNESIPNANGTMSIGGKFVEGYIKGEIANYQSTDHKWLKDFEGGTIQLLLATGKVIVARDAVQVDESVGNVEQGSFPVQFNSDDVEEVR